MLKFRSVLISFFGGSETMWDVALGVIIAGLVLGVLYLTFGFIVHLMTDDR